MRKKNLRLDQDKCEDGEILTIQNCRVGLRVKATTEVDCNGGLVVPAGQQGVVDQVSRAPNYIYLYGNRALILTVKWGNRETRVHKCIENIVISCK